MEAENLGPGGWVKVYRKIILWRWASSPSHMALFLQLILRANYKETKWRKEVVASGQILTGSNQLSEWTGLSRAQVRRALKDFVDSGEITIKTTNKYSIITITNWESHQSNEPSENQQVANKEPTSSQQRTTSKKVNNIKKVKKYNNIIPSPLAEYFTDPDISVWLTEGTHDTHLILKKQYTRDSLIENIPKAHSWALPKGKRADAWLITWMSNVGAFKANGAAKTPKTNKGQGVAPSSENPTGNPYIQEAREKGYINE